MDKNKDLIVIGTTSLFGKFLCNYPFRVMFTAILFGELITFVTGANSNILIKGPIILSIVCLPIILLMYFLSNKWCYKIEIDKSTKSIIFYRLCNRAACVLSLDKIKIVIGSYCHIFISGSEFILHADYIHDLVSYLPKNTVIEYRGSVGKYKENHWEKGPLIPGNKL